jgi:hypothetical protein
MFPFPVNSSPFGGVYPFEFLRAGSERSRTGPGQAESRHLAANDNRLPSKPDLSTPARRWRYSGRDDEEKGVSSHGDFLKICYIFEILFDLCLIIC